MEQVQKEVRPSVRGKFLFCGEKKFSVKGVTYGTFAPNSQGEAYPEPALVEEDFSQMAAQGINALRTYTVPPQWLLDLAWKCGLRVMVGLPWEQHIAFLDEPQRQDEIEARVRAEVATCAGHPALLCYAIGNEIPSPIVRWHGHRRIAAFLKRLYRAVKAEDADSLVTYVNYPSSEYLELPFVDFLCFNVYLEDRDSLAAYLARLQNLAGDKPLVMAEIGLDSRRNGEEKQAQVLAWQIATIFAGGCAGCFVFAWTDRWYRGGYDIDDWDFGLTNRDRQPKPALASVSQAFAEVPLPANLTLPKISVAVCSYNGSRTIRDTLEGLQHLEYPDYEVIVVDDGSQDGVADIARQYPGVRVIIHPENRGLSCARNTALAAATGEIVAYIDDDAYPDAHWLSYLAITFLEGDWAGVGGPNLPPPGDGLIADCVANAPGGPIHVLISDREAEHIPGCNMAYWKSSLEEIDGFDARYRAAGDDVDVCWRLQERGGKIGFSPAALVWHHRRNSLKAYWKQQQGYGKAEALLEEKWPQRYNAAGHISWAGRLYGKGVVVPLGWQKNLIYQGIWGSAPFQSLYQPHPGLIPSLPAMPEWYLLIFALGGLSLLGIFYAPLRLAILPLAASLLVLVIQAIVSAAGASFVTPGLSRLTRFGLYALTALLYLAQPLARLWGRLDNGLTPWRRRGGRGWQLPQWQTYQLWSESWQSPEQWLGELDGKLRQGGAVVCYGGDFDAWDLQVRGGLLGSLRILMAIEEHGSGKQLIRFRLWPQVAPAALGMALFLGILAGVAAWDGGVIASVALGGASFFLLLMSFLDCAAATASCLEALGGHIRSD